MKPDFFSSVGKKIICVGRNYAQHCIELGNEIPKRPVYFLKPANSIITPPQAIQLPTGIGQVHHEVELAVLIGSGGSNIPISQAMKCISGYCLALDLTARDCQDVEKQKSWPWVLSKAQDGFLPLQGSIIEPHKVDVENASIWLKLNGIVKQRGNTSDMIFKVPVLLSHISTLMTLQPGDIILTGTPAGVGPLTAGDHVQLGLSLNDGTESTVTFDVKEDRPPPPLGVATFPLEFPTRHGANVKKAPSHGHSKI